MKSIHIYYIIECGFLHNLVKFVNTVMRTLTELSLNGDKHRLKALLADPIVSAHWKEWGEDNEAMPQDKLWAMALEYLE